MIAMYRVLIPCPSTGQLVPTGSLVDPERSDALPSTPIELEQCPACGKPHLWSRWSAVLQASPEVA